MLIERLFDWLPLVVLIATLFAAKVRAWVMQRRGQRVVVVDWKRPPSEMLYDTLIVAVALCWIYLLIAEASPFTLAWLPDWLTTPLIDYSPLRLIGAAILLIAPLLFAMALVSFKNSWRIGIDRQQSPPLVTSGVFAYTRNPIYTAFDMIIVGTFLVHGRAIFLLFATALVLLVHGVVLREERYLEEQFGDAFHQYKSRVRRYGVL